MENIVNDGDLCLKTSRLGPSLNRYLWLSATKKQVAVLFLEKAFQLWKHKTFGRNYSTSSGTLNLQATLGLTHTDDGLGFRWIINVSEIG